MFQTFESQSERGASSDRIKELRRLMAAQKLDAYLVPRADEHQGEYVPASAARLKFLTGFSGSAGLAIVMKKSAVLFTDGRYTVQARAEVEPGLVEVSLIPRQNVGAWLAEHLPRGGRVGFDARLHTVAEVERLVAALQRRTSSWCRHRAISSTACGAANARRRRKIRSRSTRRNSPAARRRTRSPTFRRSSKPTSTMRWC